MLEKAAPATLIAIFLIYAVFIGAEGVVNYLNGDTETLQFNLEPLNYITVTLIGGTAAWKIADKKWRKP